jgi:Cys-rich repeat protein
MVQCPANSTCLVTNAGPLCACNPGYAPHGATGCKKEGCGSDAECGEGRICRSGRCLAGDTIEKYRRTGKSMLIPGLVLMPIGVAFVGLGVYFWYQARTCTTDPFFGIRSCHTNTGTTEYRLYAGFMISGVLALGAGVALTIVGAVKLRRARELELGLSPVVPFVTAVPGGGMAGIVMRF